MRTILALIAFVGLCTALTSCGDDTKPATTGEYVTEMRDYVTQMTTALQAVRESPDADPRLVVETLRDEVSEMRAPTDVAETARDGYVASADMALRGLNKMRGGVDGGLDDVVRALEGFLRVVELIDESA